jgi:hypothetical protein
VIGGAAQLHVRRAKEVPISKELCTRAIYNGLRQQALEYRATTYACH